MSALPFPGSLSGSGACQKLAQSLGLAEEALWLLRQLEINQGTGPVCLVDTPLSLEQGSLGAALPDPHCTGPASLPCVWGFPALLSPWSTWK